MKIYTVYKGKLFDLEVRETKKMFFHDEPDEKWISEKNEAFRWKRSFYKEECYTNVDEAINKALNKVRQNLDRLKSSVAKDEAELERILALKEAQK